MLTLRTAASLLAAATSHDALLPLSRAIGFTGRAGPLDAAARRGIGLGAEARAASVIAGDGALRALVVELQEAAPARDVLARLASRLSARAAHGLWMVLATQAGGRAVGVAAWSSTDRGPRLAACLVDRHRILDSDAETLRLLAAAGTGQDLTTHARWIDILGRDAMSRRFFRALRRLVGELDTVGPLPAAARDELALLCTSRLLFLSFLEARGWLDGDAAFLANRFDECMRAGGGFHQRVLQPLFFGTLNTPAGRRAARARGFGRVPFLNGGLFSPTPLERRHRHARFTDASLGALMGDLLGRYRFTAREESTSLEEAAVDPEMLGRAFECLMASAERRESGAFYTPFALVEHVTRCGLGSLLIPRLGDRCTEVVLAGREIGDGDRRTLRDLLAGTTVLDPACGSGAFLVHALDRLAAMATVAGDLRPPHQVRRALLARSIFGVDANPMAVWLCQLRLWLSIAIECDAADPRDVPPLPNLDRNIRVGDALAGEAIGRAIAERSHRRLRDRYARATGTRKRTVARQLDRVERSLALDGIDARSATVRQRRADLLAAVRGRDLFGARTRPTADERRCLAELRREVLTLRTQRERIALGGALPFSYATHFGDVVGGGGFSLVIGNPPWVRPHRVAPADRAQLRARFRVARGAAWQSGAIAAGAGAGFGAQADLAALFVERAVDLTRPGGVVALLVPAKLWRSLAGGGVRELLRTATTLTHVEDRSDARASFEAAVYPGIVVARRDTARDSAQPVTIAVADGAGSMLAATVPADALPLDSTPGAPWLLMHRASRRAFDRLAAAGTPLWQSHFGRPLLGVKCGLNAAYVVKAAPGESAIVRIAGAEDREALVERCLLRPVLRGEDIRRWTAQRPLSIIWTHDAHGAPMPSLPPQVSRWFGSHRRALLARADARSTARWWELFRVDAARDDRARVVWADMGQALRAVVLSQGDRAVPLNSCYAIACAAETDAHALAALFNSPLASAWLDAIAEPARGGFRRYLGWTVALLPLPRNWAAASAILAPLGRAAAEGAPPDDQLLARTVAEAFDIAPRDMAPLLAWGCR